MGDGFAAEKWELVSAIRASKKMEEVGAEVWCTELGRNVHFLALQENTMGI